MVLEQVMKSDLVSRHDSKYHTVAHEVKNG